ncbi:MAG: glycosyltransferase [Fibrobacterota bacterium]|nr:MAG: glycosyltransferase [Fibrobacterota bacterium]
MIRTGDVDVSVVVVSYNVRDRLRESLESLRSLDNGSPRIEVIVVDNASADDTVEVLSPEFPEVQFLAMDRNLGFSIGCNRGAALARAEWILFLNPDTVVLPETLREMKAFVDRNPELGIAGCRIVDGDGKLQLACRRSIPTPKITFQRLSGLSILFPRSHTLGRYNLTYLDPAGTYPVEAVSGSFLWIRTEVFREVQGFDEIFFLYGEDLDLCLRVARAGWEIWYHGSVHIVHHKGQSAATRPLGARINFYQAMVVFARKNFGVGVVLGGGLTLVAWLLAAMGHFGQSMRRWRRVGMDFVSINLSFFAISSVWLWMRESGTYLGEGRSDWVWHPVITFWFLGAMLLVGDYSGGPVSRRNFLTGLAAAVGGFLVTGFLARSIVFSRGSFIIGAGLACAAILGRHLLHARRARTQVHRALVVGVGPLSQDLARRFQSSSRIRLLGFLALQDEPLPESGEVMPLASMPNPMPALKALEARTLVIPTDERISRTLAELRQLKQVKLFLALPTPRDGEPVLVDITLDNNFPTERSQ